MISRNDLERVRSLVEQNIGQRIRITVKKGRKKVLTRYGTINAVYPFTFNITLESLSEFAEVNRNLSLNYTDILTHSIGITVIETETDII
ncbi:MAG: Veg family protein [Clostridia bacterium]|nr:Veg family protein [Clostridia bacterium]